MKHPRAGHPQHPVVELEIEDLAYGGDGVGRHAGRVWFVPFTIPGERIRARAGEIKKDFVRAELVEVLRSAPERTSPRCAYFGQCGGCAYQHIAYEAQLRYKQSQVGAVLRRIGKMTDPPVGPVVASPEPYGYRNRITVHISRGITGFHRVGGRGLMGIERCEIAREEINTRLAAFRAGRPFDGHRTLRADNCPPEGFRQTNDLVAELLREHVREMAGGPGEWLVEAYCGSGFFCSTLAADFRKVTGIDWSAPAIGKALSDHPANAEFLQGAVEDLLPELLGNMAGAPDVILLDPPSGGLSGGLADLLCSHPPARALIYVSCDPATFARDSRILTSAFRLAKVTPFDMFPQTAGIEIAALFLPGNP